MAEVDTPTTARSGSPPARPVPPVRSGPGLRPALVVLGIAALLLAVFAVGAIVAGGHPAPHRAAAARQVPGTSLVAVPAAPDLHAIVQAGSPPSNIVQAVTVPRGTAARGSVHHAARSSQFDAQVSLQVSTTEGELIAFYRNELRATGWQLLSQGAPTGQAGYQLLAKKAGDDGWYWEVGVTISPTTFDTRGAGTTGATRFVIRLLQLPDAD